MYCVSHLLCEFMYCVNFMYCEISSLCKSRESVYVVANIIHCSVDRLSCVYVLFSFQNILCNLQSILPELSFELARQKYLCIWAYIKLVVSGSDNKAGYS